MTISIRLTDAEEDRLDTLARRTGRSKSFHVETALREYLTEPEDAFAADAAIDVFEAEGRRSRPLSALEAETDGLQPGGALRSPTRRRPSGAQRGGSR